MTKVGSSILVIPLEQVDGIQKLLDIVSNDGKMGKKSSTCWVISTAAKFNPDGSDMVHVYNELLFQSEVRGFSYIQITFKKEVDNGNE